MKLAPTRSIRKILLDLYGFMSPFPIPVYSISVAIIYVTKFWKTYHLHTKDKQNNYKYFTKFEMGLHDRLTT